MILYVLDFQDVMIVIHKRLNFSSFILLLISIIGEQGSIEDTLF